MLARPLTTLAVLAAILPLAAMAPTIKREYTPNRVKLTDLETKPLSAAATADLADWSHPGTLDAARTKDKVVLLAVVSASDPQSIMTISALTRMERDFQDQGIVVAAISPDEGFEDLTEKIAAGKITIPVARDAGGTFAAAMHTDDYPDLYLIDRAGNLRFADLDQSSLKAAVKLLTSETPKTAVANAQLQSKGLAPEPAEKTAAVAKVDPELYKAAKWPAHNTGKLYAKNNIQGKPLPVPMGNEKWVYNERPLEGKVLVLDFWATWCGPCKQAMPMFEQFQDHYEGKLEIVGIGGSEEYATFKKFVMNKKGNYAQMFDQRKTISSAIGIEGIPHVVILSTDGIVRWQGNPLSDSFVTALNQVIAVDPLLALNN